MTPSPNIVAKPKTLHCPNCGGPVERRGFAHTLTIACPQCGTVLDATSPLLDILQRAEAAQKRQPLIPLGTRGQMENAEWETIGFQVREIYVDGDRFEWEEYLLFNPYRGFRYLTRYEGHWNWVAPLESVPAPGALRTVSYGGHTYKHFSRCEARTAYVLGEFPWQVRVGDRVDASDYIAPPYILSSESTAGETTWSQGVYVSGADVWRAFQLPGHPPRASGVYLNQPSPYKGSVAGMWSMTVVLLTLLGVLAVFFALFSKRETVLELDRTFSARATGEPSFVTPVFELAGRPATLEVATSTDLSNNWAYFNFALINDDTGEAYDFGREVSYYAGRDSDGDWTEGRRRDAALMPAVPSGHYYLRVEPEMDANAPPVHYSIRLRHDVPAYGWFLIAGVLILIPPVLYTIRVFNFERQRWAESDYAPAINLNDDDD